MTRVQAFIWGSICLGVCFTFIGCQLSRIDETACDDSEWRYLLETYRYLERSDTIDVFLEYHGATEDTRRTVSQKTRYTFSTHSFLPALCAHTTAEDLKRCLVGPSSDVIDRAYERSEEVLGRLEQSIDSTRNVAADHRQQLKCLDQKSSIGLVDYTHYAKRDSAVTVRFGPIFYPSDDQRDVLPYPIYVTGEIAYHRNYLYEPHVWTDFMVGIDSTGTARQLYIHPAKPYSLVDSLKHLN